ncbi:MAG TPA: formylglycine-generating enzyme family protein [Polyangiaceae bacterium]|jgi:formylglycine-generating enzyme required for sulfatase activity
MVAVPGGAWQPIFEGTEKPPVRVEPFYLDRDPVTNQQFLGFVRVFFNYRRNYISKLFADEAYLVHWAGPTELGAVRSDQPVTNVSWFAARAYCTARGARLPAEAEWEYAASAGEKQADGANEPGFADKILSWYAQPAPNVLPTVGRSRPNYFGVRDLHGLVWEWVLDFNGTLLTSDSRTAKGSDVQAFCGAGAFGFRDSRNYAAFMRAAFRSSLSANYTARSLGFRCARDGGPGGEG